MTATTSALPDASAALAIHAGAGLARDGFHLLRGAIPPAWLAPLRRAFDESVCRDWAVPRGPDWRHARLDLDPTVREVCRLPALIRVVGERIGGRFFLAQVEGREPLPGGGHQGLHRDYSARNPGDTINALAFFDDYGPENGATRLVPRTHRDTLPREESAAIQLNGLAGDLFVFDANLLHAATRNPGHARRRSILMSFQAASLHDLHRQTAALRSVRMDPVEFFDPPS